MIIRSGESYVNTDTIIRYESVEEKGFGVIKIWTVSFGLNLAWFETLAEAQRILKDIMIGLYNDRKYYFIESNQLINEPDPNESCENLIN